MRAFSVRVDKLIRRAASCTWKVPFENILKIHSLNVKSMQTHYELYAHLMRGRSDLSRTQREMIAVVASAANRCRY